MLQLADLYALTSIAIGRPLHLEVTLDQLGDLHSSGLVAATTVKGQAFTVTERGRAFLQILCKTPLPVQRWVDPRPEGASHG